IAQRADDLPYVRPAPSPSVLETTKPSSAVVATLSNRSINDHCRPVGVHEVILCTLSPVGRHPATRVQLLPGPVGLNRKFPSPRFSRKASAEPVSKSCRSESVPRHYRTEILQ